MAAALLFRTTLVLTRDYRCDEVLKAPKLSFISVSTDTNEEYMDYSSVITIPCGYYAVQVNVSEANFKIRRGYYGDKNVITWSNWLVLKQ